jgi:hypothetical protein
MHGLGMWQKEERTKANRNYLLVDTGEQFVDVPVYENDKIVSN